MEYWQWILESTDQDTTVYIDSVGTYDLYFKVKDDWGCEDSLLLAEQSMLLRLSLILLQIHLDALGLPLPLSQKATMDL